VHTALTGGFLGLTGDAANPPGATTFLSIVVAAIMASRADCGAIAIGSDEAEAVAAGDNPEDLTHTIGEIVISPLTSPKRPPFASPVLLTHL
jgi:hypothetical protein